jgi:NAD(P)-dependent dehydrogenase (short-subunit alcohol dehydrogenase family)
MKKVAIVTGASRGIGRAIAERLAKDGFAVVVNYATSSPEAEEVVSKVTAEGGEAIAIEADINDATQVEQLFAKTLDKFRSVDVVVQNAGVMSLSPIAKGDAATFDKVISVNLRGTFLVFAQAAQHISARSHHRSLQQRPHEIISHLWAVHRVESWGRGIGTCACKRTPRAQRDCECGGPRAGCNRSLPERYERSTNRGVH